jgi:hypothetical protein
VSVLRHVRTLQCCGLHISFWGGLISDHCHSTHSHCSNKTVI